MSPITKCCTYPHYTTVSGGTGCVLWSTNTGTLTPNEYEVEDHFAVFLFGGGGVLCGRKDYVALRKKKRDVNRGRLVTSSLPPCVTELLAALVCPVVLSFPLYYHGQCSPQPSGCVPPLRRARTTKLSTHSHAFSAQLPNARLTAVFIFHPLYLK